MRTEILTPASPGFYAGCPTLVGAPTPWQAVAASDGAYIASGVSGQRHSFVPSLPAIGSDTLVSLVVKGMLSRPDDSGDFSDGGFENGTWFLGTSCPVNGATINTVLANVRSGASSLRINTRNIGPTCGFASRLISGLTVGHTYSVSGYFKTASITTEKFEVRVDGVSLGFLGSSSPSSFTAFGPVTFVATATSHTLAIVFTQFVGIGLRTYYFDDVTLAGLDSASVFPSYRLFGQDVDLPPWTLTPGQTSFSQQSDRAISILGGQLQDGGFELGLRNGANASVQVDRLWAEAVFQPLSDHSLAGHRRRGRTH